MTTLNLNFVDNNSRTRVTGYQHRRVGGELQIGKNTYILGFDDEEIYGYIVDLFCNKIPKIKDKHKDIFKIINVKSKVFLFKNVSIRIEDCKVAGLAEEYHSDVLQYCYPKKGKYYYNYGSQEYEYFNVGITEAPTMWKTLLQVIHSPKYALIYARS